MTTLTDSQIAAEMKHGRLIKNGEVGQLSGACYELRLGSVYYDLSENSRRIQLEPGQDVLIKPGHRVVLITYEELEVPPDLPQLESIAKADFTRLTENVDRPYKGQHGFRTEIWPIKYQLQKLHDDVAGDSRVGTEKEEGYRLLPQTTAEVLRELERRQVWTDAALILAIVFNAIVIFLVGNKLMDSFQGLVGNLVASILAGFFVLYTKKKK
jgi:dCTP deaminase